MLFILFAYPHSLSIEKLFKCETFMNYSNGKLCAASLQNRFSPLNQSVTLFPRFRIPPPDETHFSFRPGGGTKLIFLFRTPGQNPFQFFPPPHSPSIHLPRKIAVAKKQKLGFDEHEEANAMDTEAIEEEQLPPVNVRTGCICQNQGRPVNGMILINPCCRMHYAEKGIPQVDPEEEITKEELAEWALDERKQSKKRITHPKMAVARS